MFVCCKVQKYKDQWVVVVVFLNFPFSSYHSFILNKSSFAHR